MKKKNGEPLPMALWRDLVQHSRDPDVMPDSFEFEGELLPGEHPWIDAADHVKSLQELEQGKAIDACLDPHVACANFDEEVQEASHVIVAVEGEEPAVVEEAVVAAREVAKCERLRSWAVSMKMPFSACEAFAKKNTLSKRNNPKATETRLKCDCCCRKQCARRRKERQSPQSLRSCHANSIPQIVVKSSKEVATRRTRQIARTCRSG